ncbi:GerAB/ArcD/ProY family transporter [Oceanobacillus damuensis]|uniref:GerAB/ArcD/ProY family transporter n=1 Tax=Oceanobacillus damuensis TaxID=937928 RepID=UPI00082FFFA3|nr:GerAB/ArcD/ProY family transporter [Oceanobacillus damuensis]
MDVNVKLKPSLSIEAFYLFFIITSIQLGVGMMGAPRYIFLEAKQDSWISIILAIIFSLIVLFVMLYILKQYENADILGIQVDIFGKWIGKLLGLAYIAYFAGALLSVVLTYIEVVKIFIFPEVSSLLMGVVLTILIIYTVLGGLRVIVGVCFLFFLLTHWLLLLLIEPATAINFDHFSPPLQASVTELLSGAKASSYTFMGIEILFLIYPFIVNKEKTKLPITIAALWTGAIILLTTVITIGFFSPEQLLRREWSVLALFKIQTFTFIERFDYIVVAEWMMVSLPNMVLLMWALTYSMKRMYKVPQKVTLYTASIFLLIGCATIEKHYHIQKVITIVSDNGFWLIFVYPILLLPFVLIKKKWKKARKV